MYIFIYLSRVYVYVNVYSFSIFPFAVIPICVCVCVCLNIVCVDIIITLHCVIYTTTINRRVHFWMNCLRDRFPLCDCLSMCAFIRLRECFILYSFALKFRHIQRQKQQLDTTQTNNKHTRTTLTHAHSQTPSNQTMRIPNTARGAPRPSERPPDHSTRSLTTRHRCRRRRRNAAGRAGTNAGRRCCAHRRTGADRTAGNRTATDNAAAAGRWRRRIDGSSRSGCGGRIGADVALGAGAWHQAAVQAALDGQFCVQRREWNPNVKLVFCNPYILFHRKNLVHSPCAVKLNSGGSSWPLGKRCVLLSRSSLKNGWAHACSGVMRALGVYSSSRDTSMIASGGVRWRNTCTPRSTTGRKNTETHTTENDRLAKRGRDCMEWFVMRYLFNIHWPQIDSQKSLAIISGISHQNCAYRNKWNTHTLAHKTMAKLKGGVIAFWWPYSGCIRTVRLLLNSRKYEYDHITYQCHINSVN